MPVVKSLKKQKTKNNMQKFTAEVELTTNHAIKNE